jgi:hypothetical protein
MKLRRIFPLLIFLALILLVTGCGGDSQSLPEERGLDATPSSTSDHKTGEQIVILGQTRYDIECVDDDLGMKRSDEIFHDNGEITPEETDKVRHCVMDSQEKSGGTPETEIISAPTSERALAENAWRPSLNDAVCADRVIGIKAFREIYQGVRTPSESESEAWKTCLADLSLASIVHPLAGVECPDVENMWQARHTFAPRWEQIECHTNSLIRRDLPQFRAHDRFPLSGSDPNAASIWPFSFDALLSELLARDWAEYDQSSYEGRDLDLWKIMELLEEELAGNWAFMPMGDFPPYIDEFGENIAYPPSNYWHDQALRIFSLHALQRKNAGHPIVMVDFYPPGMLSAPASNANEFREWIDAVFVPQKIHEAGIAELLKAEIFFPLPIEIERWVQAQPWANTTSTQEKVRTAQYVLDRVYDDVRPIFKGRLDVWSYANYLPDRDGPDWSSLVFANYDEVSFHLFPECDTAFSVSYAENQMKNVMDIVRRDGLTWWIGEWTLKRKSFEQLCGTDMSREAVHIMDAMLDVVFAQPVKPIGIDYRGPIYSTEQLDLIVSRIFSLADH